MIAGTFLTLLLGAAALAYIVMPMLLDDGSTTQDASTALSNEQEALSRQQMLLAALKDLEDDRSTDKIGDEDYARLKSRLSGQAIETMQRLDALQESREKAEEEAIQAAAPLRYPGKKRPDRGR
jgi:hypothetical protein